MSHSITKELKRYHQKRIAQIQSLSTLFVPEDDGVREARKQRARADYDFFCSYYFAHLTQDKKTGTPVANGYFHADASRYIKDNPRARALFEWARAHAKSTHLCVLIPLWLKIQNEIKVMVLVGKSEQSATQLLSDMQAELQYNERFIHDFGEQVKFGDWQEGRFVTRDDAAFFALGRGQSPRGLKYLSNRPDYIVVDDIDDDEMVRNEKRVKQTWAWLMESLFNTMDAGAGRFIIVGNRISTQSVIALAAENPAFYHTKTNALNTKGEPTWGEKYTLAQLTEVRKTIGEIAWQKEYMNNPIVEGAVFKHFHFCTPLAYKDYAYLVCYTDPSFKNSDTSDYKATVLVGKTRAGHYHILRAFLRRASVTDMVKWHYAIHELVGVSAVVHYYMEANYIQDILLGAFYKMGDKIGFHLPIRGDKRAKPDKYQRIENLEPYFTNQKLFFSLREKNTEDMRRLIEQFRLFQKGSRVHDDGPDAVEGAVFLLNQHTRENAPIHTQKRAPQNNKNRF